MESRIIDHNPTIYLTTKGGGVPQDVYKRQVAGIVVGKCGYGQNTKKSRFIVKVLRQPPMPVSYTHLDVYKRQMRICAAAVLGKGYNALAGRTAEDEGNDI